MKKLFENDNCDVSIEADASTQTVFLYLPVNDNEFDLEQARLMAKLINKACDFLEANSFKTPSIKGERI